MSYFGLMTLFPALLLLLALSNKITAGTEMLAYVVQVYPGSGKFLHETIRSLSGISTGVIITCALIVLWMGVQPGTFAAFTQSAANAFAR